MNALPPFAPTSYGNFQMLPIPTAEPTVARMKPMRPDQASRPAAIHAPRGGGAAGDALGAESKNRYCWRPRAFAAYIAASAWLSKRRPSRRPGDTG
jgi:hypothetical protein